MASSSQSPHVGVARGTVGDEQCSRECAGCVRVSSIGKSARANLHQRSNILASLAKRRAKQPLQPGTPTHLFRDYKEELTARWSPALRIQAPSRAPKPGRVILLS